MNSNISKLTEDVKSMNDDKENILKSVENSKLEVEKINEMDKEANINSQQATEIARSAEEKANEIIKIRPLLEILSKIKRLDIFKVHNAQNKEKYLALTFSSLKESFRKFEKLKISPDEDFYKENLLDLIYSLMQLRNFLNHRKQFEKIQLFQDQLVMFLKTENGDISRNYKEIDNTLNEIISELNTK